MDNLELNGVEIEDTFCEAFGGFFSRVLVTAKNEKWVKIAGQVATGYATSTIACDAEAGIDMMVPADQTPDKRPGIALMFFIMKEKQVGGTLRNRIGQCILTCPTTACFDAMKESLKPEAVQEVKTGFQLKFFGDKYEEKVDIAGIPAWKIPVMGGEFIIQDSFKYGKGIAGGNFLIIGKDQDSTLEAAEKSVEAIGAVENVISAFPGGVARSGSKVGTQYENIPGLFATTNHAYCPTLRTKVPDTQLRDGDGAVYEIILDGATENAIKTAMKVGIEAAVKVPGVNRISAGNYGGKLGKFQYRLHDVLS